MEKEVLLELLFHSSTNKELREEQLLNVFGVTTLDDIPTEKLLEFCNQNHVNKEVNYGCKV